MPFWDRGKGDRNLILAYGPTFNVLLVQTCIYAVFAYFVIKDKRHQFMVGATRTSVEGCPVIEVSIMFIFCHRFPPWIDSEEIRWIVLIVAAFAI